MTDASLNDEWDKIGEPAMTDKCERCAVLEDLLETARIQVEHARREAEKADDEARELKTENLRQRIRTGTTDYELVMDYKARAEKAEAILAATPTPPAGDR